jgi:DNA-binding NarL/FixJ family response regulator
MPATDIKQRILELYRGGAEDSEIAEQLGIDESFVSNVIDAFEEA